MTRFSNIKRFCCVCIDVISFASYVILVGINFLYIFHSVPYFLIINSLFLLSHSFFVGPLVLYSWTIFFFALTIIDLLYILYTLLLNDIYIFYSFGHFYFISDIIDIHFLFCVDTLSVVCSLLVLILGLFTLQFAVEYMYRDAHFNYLLYFLSLFISTIVVLFFAFDLTVFIACWESIGLLSYVLVNYYKGRIFTIKSAFKTFIYSRISDTGLFIAFILISYEFNTTDFSSIFIMIPFYMFHEVQIGSYSFHYVSLIACLIFSAASIKAAQFWWHVWLPDAMDAPTPASALIHSSTLVIMGIYMLLRFSILLEFTYLVNFMFAIYGGITIAVGSLAAITQTDLKKLIAYSTISQIGYLFMGCGFCCFNEVLIYLIVHALNKATLFIIAGSVIHFFKGNTDMRFMGAINTLAFDFCVGVFIIWANLSGMPFSFGFFSKEFLLFQCARDDILSIMTFVSLTISIICTPIYTYIILNNVLFGPYKTKVSIISATRVTSTQIQLKVYNFNFLKLFVIWNRNLSFLFLLNFISSIILVLGGIGIFTIILFGDTYIIDMIYNIIGQPNLFIDANYIHILKHLTPMQSTTFVNNFIIDLNNFIKLILILLAYVFIYAYHTFYYCKNLFLLNSLAIILMVLI